MLRLTVLPGEFVICRFEPDAPVPLPEQAGGGLLSITRTASELSVVCAASVMPDGGRCEKGWRCIGVGGPLPFSATGILASLATPLAAADIPIFALSTFDTDYLLVREVHLEKALAALEASGHRVDRSST